jgi:hypothetical protein
VLDLIKQMYPKATTLADIGITKVREAKILQAIAESYSVPQINPDKETMYRQITETFEPTPESIWEEIDMLEGDPAHRGMVMCNARFKFFWVTAETSEWQGQWDKGTFKKWKRSDLLKNDRVLTSRYVYKIKR